MQQKEKQIIKILFLRRILRKAQNYNGYQIFGKFGIGVTKYEICSNLKDSRNFSLISTIEKNSDKKITYYIRDRIFKNENINVFLEGRFSNVEQIYNDTLVTSGGKKKEERKFVIHRLMNKNLEFQMQEGRQFHRTNFDKSSFIFIISGQVFQNDQQIELSECEVFDLRKNNFKQINSIEIPVCLFGCDQDASQLCVFGGFKLSLSQAFNTIQIYDKIQNTWQKSEVQIDQVATTSAVCISKTKSFLIYNNGYFNLDTQVFDFKKIVKLNQYFPEENLNFTQPVLSRNTVFQFDENSNLFSYDLNGKGWRQVKA